MGQVVRGGFQIFLYFLFVLVWLILAFEYLRSVGVWHIILVVHIHILDIIVVLPFRKCIIMQSILCSMSLSVVVQKERKTY